MDPPDAAIFCESLSTDDRDYEPWLVSYLKLAIVCVAAWHTAALVVRLPGKFIPRGTGLLVAGLAASVAGMIFDRVAKVEVLTNSRTGRPNRLNIYFPINYVCMSFIAYATGAQLVATNYRGLGRRIVLTALSVSCAVLCFVGPLAYLLLVNPSARFMRFSALSSAAGAGEETAGEMDVLLAQPGAPFAIAIMIAGILTSRSPASAISIVAEMRANGPFTKTALGGTCALYFVSNLIFPIVLFFARAAMAPVMADVCLGEGGGAVDSGAVVGSFLMSLVFTLLVGLVIGRLLFAIVGLPARRMLKLALRVRSLHAELYVKCSLALLIGLGTFLLKLLLMSVDLGSSIELKIEPLLVCLIAATYVVNARGQAHAAEWKRMCSACAPYIYCVFFALAGSSVNFAAVYESQFAGPMLLVVLRAAAILVGTLFAALLERRRPSRGRHYSWLNYITQAGVALSFAQEVLDEPSLPLSMRSYVYTLVVTTVFINQLVGPPCFKIALRLSGEAFIDHIGGARLVSVEGQAPRIEVKTLTWETRAGVGSSHVARVSASETGKRVVRRLSEEHLLPQLGEAAAARPFAFLSMLEEDADNVEACGVMRRLYGAPRAVIHQNDPSRRAAQLSELGAFVLGAHSLVVGSLDQFLSSAQAAELLLHRDRRVDVIVVQVGMDAAGVHVSQLDLPRNVLVVRLLRQARDGAAAFSMVPSQCTQVRYEDQLTLCGPPQSLSRVTAVRKGKIALVNDCRPHRKNSGAERTAVRYRVSPSDEFDQAMLGTKRVVSPG